MRRSANVESRTFLNKKWLNTNEKVACMELAAISITQLKNADTFLYNIVSKLSDKRKKMVQRAENKEDGWLQIRKERLHVRARVHTHTHTHTHTHIYIYIYI